MLIFVVVGGKGVVIRKEEACFKFEVLPAGGTRKRHLWLNQMN